MPTKMSELLDNLGIQKEQRNWEYAKFGKGWNMKNGHDKGKFYQGNKNGVLFPKLILPSKS